jgi:hypothetical protein
VCCASWPSTNHKKGCGRRGASASGGCGGGRHRRLLKVQCSASSVPSRVAAKGEEEEEEARPGEGLDVVSSRREALWEKRFQDLRAFKAEHGHLVVPVSRPRSSLKSWVAYQRLLRRRGTLSPQRQDALEALGFCWEPLAKGAAKGERGLGVIAKARWEKRFQELRAFEAAHGHLVVPTRGPWCTLSRWVAYQSLKRERGTLSRERQDALEELGFRWEESDGGGPKAGGVAKAKWEKRFTELRAFKAAHGHLVVPARGPWCSLCSWVYRQRLLRRRGTLSLERGDALRELGFRWEPANAVVGATGRAAAASRGGDGVRCSSTHDEKWAMKFEELRGFCKAHGHTRVPSNTKLHLWLHNQRRVCAKGALCDERRASLQAIGVDFRVKPRVAWAARLGELRAFRDAHGHCAVPATWRHNKTLGSWVAAQRKHHRAGTLSAERKDALEQLGFEWERKRLASTASSSRSFHVRQNASPWALVGNGGGGSGGNEGRRADVTWIGGPEVEAEQQQQQQRSDEEEEEEGVGNVLVGGWGKGSSAYEEKQQYVFNRINGWWNGDGGDEKRWRDARGKVRAMRYNYAIQAKQRRIKPDIVIEVEEIEGNQIWGLVIEVDEFAHRRGKHYGWRAEEERMQELQATLDVPLKIVRFNPDPDVANPMALEDRTHALVEHVVESMRSAPVRDLEVAYVMYGLRVC